MSKFKLMIAAALLVASSLPALAASQEAEDFAISATAMMGLAAQKCDLGKVDITKLIANAETVSEQTGVHPADYPKGEWMRKVALAISQKDHLRRIDQGEPEAVKTFCGALAEKFPVN
jgi:hypothetical protein